MMRTALFVEAGAVAGYAACFPFAVVVAQHTTPDPVDEEWQRFSLSCCFCVVAVPLGAVGGLVLGRRTTANGPTNEGTP
ncbi:MAG: hypothetical protein FJ304_16470 [Planctomycetes bacterium]|nr:hypothetical protein [Planctomycetota bacterium]